MIQYTRKPQISDNPSGQPISAFGNPYLFTARRFDDKAGTYYYRNRNYEPANGRWVSRDPIGYHDGPNVYAYVQNKPVNLLDPMGDTIKFSKKVPDDLNKEDWEIPINIGDFIAAFEEICPCVHIWREGREVKISRDRKGRTPKAKDFCKCYCANIAGCNLLLKLAEPDSETLLFGSKSGNRHNDGRIGWNKGKLKGGKREDGGKYRRQSLGLAHELIHAYHVVIGTYSKNRLEEEFNTVRGENQIRLEMQNRLSKKDTAAFKRLDPRTHYNLEGISYAVPNHTDPNIDVTSIFPDCCCE